MIPKKIHYCWFGGNPLPPLAVKCIESWKKYLPDYEIKEWNEDNFDVNIIPYTQEAYQAKKYAFVSDYARFWILYKHGGLYFDTDVEVIKPMDDIIARGPFMGCEKNVSGTNSARIAPGLGLGANPGLGLYEEIIEKYSTLHFIRKDGSFNLKTVVQYTTELLCEHGLKNTKGIQLCAEVWIYPKDYLCPKDFETKTLDITDNTLAIHHYDGSWVSDLDRYAQKLTHKLIFIPKGMRGYVAKFVATTKYKGFKIAMKELTNYILRYSFK